MNKTTYIDRPYEVIANSREAGAPDIIQCRFRTRRQAELRATTLRNQYPNAAISVHKADQP